MIETEKNRKFSIKYCNQIITELTTSLDKSIYKEQDTTDQLEDCIEELKNARNIEALEHCIVGENSTNEVTTELNNIEENGEDQDIDSTNIEGTTYTHKLSLCDVFSEGREKLISMNVPRLRLNKKKRKKRFETFLQNLYEKVSIKDQSLQSELQCLKSELDLKYNCTFRNEFNKY